MAKKTATKKKTGAKTPAKPAAAKKKAVTKKTAPKKKVVTAKKKAVAKKTAPKKKVTVSKKKAAPKKTAAVAKKANNRANGKKSAKVSAASGGGKISAAFTRKQQQRLWELRDTLMDQMAGMTRETLRNNSEGGDSSAFGMHQADAGSDAYDRDFALNLLSQEQDALYEIEEALQRIEQGTYGVCEMSKKKIAEARLEAIPFARFTVECQAQLEREQMNGGGRMSVRSVFGLQEIAKDGEKSSSTESLEE